MKTLYKSQREHVPFASQTDACGSGDILRILNSTENWNAPLGVFYLRESKHPLSLDKKVCGPHSRYVRGVEERVFTVVPIKQLVVSTSKELPWLLHYIYKLVSEI